MSPVRSRFHLFIDLATHMSGINGVQHSIESLLHFANELDGTALGYGFLDFGVGCIALCVGESCQYLC